MKTTTFAIITDIHSNIESLKVSLDLINANSNVDKIICLGDCFSLGPEPEKTLELLQTLKNCTFVRGNHDRYLIEKLWEDEIPSMEGMGTLVYYKIYDGVEVQNPSSTHL